MNGEMSNSKEQQAQREPHGVSVGAGALRFERALRAPVEQVWAYLVESEKRGRWFASGRMEPREDGKLELRFRHADLSPQLEQIPDRFRQYEHGHVAYGRVTRWEPPRLLAYAWEEASGESTEVTIELGPCGEGTSLVLTHDGLCGRGEKIDIAAGWHTHLGILSDNLDGRPARPFWSTHAALEREYEQLIGS